MVALTHSNFLIRFVYLVGLNFALRAGQEHRNLRIGEHSQLILKTSRVDGRRYLQYREDISKCVNGGLKSRKTASKLLVLMKTRHTLRDILYPCTKSISASDPITESRHRPFISEQIFQSKQMV